MQSRTKVVAAVVAALVSCGSAVTALAVTAGPTKTSAVRAMPTQNRTLATPKFSAPIDSEGATPSAIASATVPVPTQTASPPIAGQTEIRSVAPTSAAPVASAQAPAAAAPTSAAPVLPAPKPVDEVTVEGTATWEIDVGSGLIANGVTPPSCNADDGAVTIENGAGVIVQAATGRLMTTGTARQQQSLYVLQCAASYQATVPRMAVYQAAFTKTPPGDGNGCYGNGTYTVIANDTGALRIGMPLLKFYYACA